MTDPIIDRAAAEWIEDLIRQHRCVIERYVDKSVSAAGIVIPPEILAAPMVPVYFLGDFTDGFDTDDGIGTVYYAESDTSAVCTRSANGYLGVEIDVGVYDGGGAPITNSYWDRVRGNIIPASTDFVMECAITSLDDTVRAGTRYARVALVADDRTADFDAGPPGTGMKFWNNSGVIAIGLYAANGITSKIYYGKGGASPSNVVVAYTPTRAQPVYLRMEYVHSTTTATFKYKGDGAGSWTTAGTVNVGAAFWTDGIGAFTAVDTTSQLGEAGGIVSTELNYLTVEYTPANVDDCFAFIPTVGFTPYLANVIYMKMNDGSLLSIDPTGIVINNAPIIVFDRDTKIIRQWNGTTETWDIVYTLPMMHAPTHEDGSGDELPVDTLAESATPGNDVSQALRPDGAGGVAFSDVSHADLTGVTSDQHHAQTHTHASHTSIGADDHHAQSHSHASHTGIGADDHHARQHAIDAAADHTSSIAEDNIMTANANGLPKDSGYKISEVGPSSLPPVNYGAELTAFFYYVLGVV